MVREQREGCVLTPFFSAWSLNLYKYHFIILHSARTFQHSSLRAHHTQTFLAKMCANFEWPWHSCSKRLGWWRKTWCTNVLDPMIYDNGLNDMLRHLLLTKLSETFIFIQEKGYNIHFSYYEFYELINLQSIFCSLSLGRKKGFI